MKPTFEQQLKAIHDDTMAQLKQLEDQYHTACESMLCAGSNRGDHYEDNERHDNAPRVVRRHRK